MPHFAIDCSEHILSLLDPKKIIQEVHNAANDSGLFDESDTKVRLNPFKNNYLVGGKTNLSKAIISILKPLFPGVPFIGYQYKRL